MPLYEYQCSKCGQVFEKIQKFSDAPLEIHEVCGGKVEKLISAPAFHLKGTGWYVTDYAKGSSKSESKKSDSKGSDDSKSSATETKSESKSESSTESKTESKPAAPAAKSD